MKSLIKVVDNTYKQTNEEIKQELTIRDLCYIFVKALNQEQCNVFVEILISRDNLEKIKIENYTLATHIVCKDVFKLR